MLDDLSGLTNSEKDVRDALNRAGYTVLRNGWPDFLVCGPDGIFAVEVKTGKDKLSREQEAIHKALEQAGVRTVTVRDGVAIEGKFNIGEIVSAAERLNGLRDHLTHVRNSCIAGLVLLDETRATIEQTVSISGPPTSVNAEALERAFIEFRGSVRKDIVNETSEDVRRIVEREVRARHNKEITGYRQMRCPRCETAEAAEIAVT